MKLQVQQKSIRLSRTIQPFPLQGVLAPNLCLLALLHSSPSDSPVSLRTRITCSVLLTVSMSLHDYLEGEDHSSSRFVAVGALQRSQHLTEQNQGEKDGV